MASIFPLQMASFPICCSNSRILLPPLSSINHLKTSNGVRGTIKSMAVGAKTSDQTPVVRRPAKIYEPSIWDYNYIQSLKSDYEGDTYTKRVDHMKREVRVMLDQAVDPLSQLELIDILERLGVSYHFEHEIEKILGSMYNNFDDKNKKDLYSVALEFRLLRQHGHNVPQGVFTSFVDESTGNFMHESLDIKGILSLYEASYVLVEGEDLLEKAREFTTKHLQDYVNKQKTLHEDQELSLLISHSLEFPLHWRVPRLETRWFITTVYEKRHDKNHVLLELSILDYNMVQAIHQKDLKLMSRWWDRLGLPEKLSFSRDRIMECFIWTLGISFEPKFGYCRQATTEMYGIISTVDDMYDNYGTEEELKLFTEFIERWDLNGAMEQLPDDMKFCFLAVYNCINEMGFQVLKKHGIDIISCLKQSWAELVRGFLVETQWYYNGYKPSMQEYVDNAWVSVGVPAVLAFSYFGATNPITKETVENFKHINEVSKWAALVLRLADDLEDDMHPLDHSETHRIMRPPRGGGFRGGRDGGRGRGGGGRFGGGGGRFGGGGGRFGGGGRGGFNEGPPDEVVEVATFLHACEGDAVMTLSNEKIPYFNAPIYLQNKTQIGKVDEIFGPINESYFSIKMMEGIMATSYASGDKFYIDPAKLLPLARFLPQPKGQAQGGRGGGRGGGGRGGFRGGRGGGGGFRGRGAPRGGRGPPRGRGGFRGRGRGGF